MRYTWNHAMIKNHGVQRQIAHCECCSGWVRPEFHARNAHARNVKCLLGLPIVNGHRAYNQSREEICVAGDVAHVPVSNYDMAGILLKHSPLPMIGAVSQNCQGAVWRNDLKIVMGARPFDDL